MLQITHQTAQGNRDYQEDRWVVEKLVLGNGVDSSTVLAVMDGHGGSEVSQLLSERFMQILAQVGLSPADENPNLQDVLAITVTTLGEMTKNMEAGSTLSVVVISSADGKAYVAVVGDSPVIIKDAHGNLNISPEHNARSNAAEREAAIARGAWYDGTYLYSPESGHGLQMSRSLGDRDLGSFLSRSPDIYSVDLGMDSYVIVASDGLLDPAHASTASAVQHIAKLMDEGADADVLVQDALERQTGDNVTAIVAKLA